MYTLSLFLLALFSLYIGVFSFWRWDASWLRELDTVPAQILFVLVFALFLLAALLLIRRVLEKLDEKSLKRLALFCIISWLRDSFCSLRSFSRSSGTIR